MSELSAREILEAIRKLSEAERRSLIQELISEDFVESPDDIAAIQEGLDQAERGELIEHDDLVTYMAAIPKGLWRSSGSCMSAKNPLSARAWAVPADR